MKNQFLKYVYTLIIVIIAILVVLSLWNYYMESPWTRDGRIGAAFINITAKTSGVINSIDVKDNQKVSKGELLFTQISADDEDKLMLLEHQLHLISDKQSPAYVELSKRLTQLKSQIKITPIYSPAEGYVTNIKSYKGDTIKAGQPLFVVVDSNSFYVIGYFEETKLKNINAGAVADIYIYSKNRKIKGYVDSISHAVYDNNIEGNPDMIPKVMTNVPWVTLAQRVPVRIRLDVPEAEKNDLIAGTSCSISIHY